MKTRIGFVSNSSSTSFLIYGISVNENDLDKEAQEKLWKSSLEQYHPPYDDDTAYIGVSLDDIELDETRWHFQERVEKLITDTLGKEYACSTYEDSWYDG